MRVARRLTAMVLCLAMSACAPADDAFAKKKPEEHCGLDRMRICGTKAKAKCDLRQHLDEVSPACRARFEKKRRKKQEKVERDGP